MPAEILSIAVVLLIAYTAFWSAYILAGQEKVKSAYAAAIPAATAAGVYLLTGTLLSYAAITLLILLGFFCVFYLSQRNRFVSVLTLMIALTLCMSGQLISAVLHFESLAALLAACAGFFIPLLLWLSKIVIFPEGYILTKDQKKTMLSQHFYFFPGLTLLLAWQIFLLSPAVQPSPYQVIFTILMQLVILLQLRQQVRSLQERIENIIDKQYQSELLNFMQVIRSQRHDFNFHMQTICGMIENGQFEECKAYVNSMMNTVKSTNDILPLYHPDTSALLNTFREMALQKGLHIEIEIHDNLRFIASSVFETNTILGNLLQNAIDELELHPENKSREIKLLIIKRGQYNIIKVSNQCHLTPEEMSRIFMPGFTTKKSHEGLGLANALRVAEKYDGTVYPEFENQTVHFIARLPMR